ncbi:hypothetical protein FJZ19_04475 [Candidatus Pacearchaeota archaeon]|nr:hypothetical protein [Candidatus Pacearchaeota archaeon]
MERKAQAAMEFLMTYGWAILAAIIAIGVLAYFGVFSPGKYVSGSALVTAPFYVNAWNVKTTGVNLELQNNGESSYNITSVNVTNCGGAGYNDFVASGSKVAIAVPCTLTAGNNFKGDITIHYIKSGSIIELTSTGSIAEKITA